MGKAITEFWGAYHEGACTAGLAWEGGKCLDGIRGGTDVVTVDLQEAGVLESGTPTWNFSTGRPREDVRDDNPAILVDEDEARSRVGDCRGCHSTFRHHHSGKGCRPP